MFPVMAMPSLEPGLAAVAENDTNQDANLVGTEILRHSTRNPLPSSHTTAPRHGSAPGHITPPGHGVTGTSEVPLKKTARALVANVSIEERTNFERSSKLGEKVLKADTIKSDALPTLAKEHLEQFKEAFGEECQRRMAPSREIRVATACTGSGAELFTLLAVLEAFATPNQGYGSIMSSIARSIH